MSQKRKSGPDQGLKRNIDDEDKQIRKDEKTIQSEKMRYKNADRIYE
ncbi:hypothetical protein [Oceanobacillus piezotolerans]|nr:hypothetical protein [Oceanobacillus piezotolerans]